MGEDNAMRGIGVRIGFVAMLASFAAVSTHAAETRPVPYWASISAGDALMRSGPGRNFPATWRYRRADLPVKVVQVHETWRKVEEPDGTEGWMAAALLSAERTALVLGEIRPMRAAPDSGARILWRAQPGVVGKISHCASGWCEFEVQGRAGYIEIAHIWGVEASETID
jgi:SH3-like domain-containing protein